MIEIEFFAYFFILFSICSIWLFEQKRFALGFALIGLLICLIAELVDIYGALTIISFGGFCWLYFKKPAYKILHLVSFICIFVIGQLLMSGYIPGIQSWRIIDSEVIGNNTVHYSLLLHLDKAFIAICLGVFGIAPLRSKRHFKYVLIRMMPVSLMTLIMLSSLGIALEIVDVDFKVPDLWLIWAIVNLLTICTSDELLHRFFVLNGILKVLGSGKVSKIIALLFSAVICCITHPGPASYMFMVFFGGILLGIVYLQTRRVEASIMLHFMINIIHFLFFSYPLLQNSYAM